MATKTWNITSTTSWNDASSWTPAGVPGNGDDVIIPNVASAFWPELDVHSNDLGSFTMQVGSGIFLQSTKILKVSGNFTLAANTMDNTGGGLIKFDGTTTLTSNSNNLKNIEITSGSTVTMADNLTVYNITNAGTLICTGFVLIYGGNASYGGIYVGGCGPYPRRHKKMRSRTIKNICRKHSRRSKR